MNKTYSTSHAGLKGKLIIFEGPDGSGKTTQAVRLKNTMKKEGKKVVLSHWKNAKHFRDFFEEQYKGGRKVALDPVANLILQAADLVYRLEKKVIPALKKGHIVVLDRGMETIYARGYSIGLTHDQIHAGILWPIENLYKDLFDQAQTIYFKSDEKTTMERMQERMDPNKHQIAEGTLIDLHMVSNLTYGEKGEKMTLAKKRALVKRIQRNMIRQYDDIISEYDHVIPIDANQDRPKVATQIHKALNL